VDPQTLGQRFLFLVDPNPAKLAPGMALTAWLQLSGQPLSGAMVPRGAALRTEGRLWVFLQTGATEFTRKEIPAGHPTRTAGS